MRVLCCGSRNWSNHLRIREALIAVQKVFGPIELLIDGHALGADTLSNYEAAKLGIRRQRFTAHWDMYGRAAGPIRNQEMIDKGKPDLVLAFHSDLKNSKGTADMVSRAGKHHIPVVVIE